MNQVTGKGMAERKGGLAAVGLALAMTMAAATAAEGGDTAAARTVESAQTFLSMMLPGNRYVSTPMAEMLDQARREGLRGGFDPKPRIIDAAPVSTCVSRLRADASQTWFVVRNPQDAWDTTEAAVEDLQGGPVIGDPVGMHFGNIRALRRMGEEVHLRFAGNTTDAVLLLDSGETAARVYDALEFLRVHCDGSRATGF